MFDCGVHKILLVIIAFGMFSGFVEELDFAIDFEILFDGLPSGVAGFAAKVFFKSPNTGFLTKS